MSRNNLFGIACKTCRRRGRKCDRSLPKCMNCSLRGVECEGYVLRWVDAATRGALAGQTYTAPDHEVDPHLNRELRTSSKVMITKADKVENSPHPRNSAKVASRAESPEKYEYVKESQYSSEQDTKSQAMSILRQKSWSILMVMGAASDDLGGLVKYCTQIPRQSGNERC